MSTSCHSRSTYISPKAIGLIDGAADTLDLVYASALSVSLSSHYLSQMLPPIALSERGFSPCVADEMSLPTVAWSKTGDIPPATEVDISVDISKRTFSLIQRRHRPAGAARRHHTDPPAIAAEPSRAMGSLPPDTRDQQSALHRRGHPLAARSRRRRSGRDPVARRRQQRPHHRHQRGPAAGRSRSITKKDSSRARGDPAPRDKERDPSSRKCQSEKTPQR